MSTITYFNDALEGVQDVLNNVDIAIVWHKKEVSTHTHVNGTITVDGEPTELLIREWDSGQWAVVCKAFHRYNERVSKHEYVMVSSLEQALEQDTLGFIDKLECVLLAGLAPYA